MHPAIQMVESFCPDLPGYWLKCAQFGRLILRKITKILVTRCQILRLKCTKFDFGWSSAPDPIVRAYSAPPDPIHVDGFKGSTSKERVWRERENEGKEKS